MRLATIRNRSHVLRDGQWVDVAVASGGRFPSDPMAAFAEWEALSEWAADVIPDHQGYHDLTPAAFDPPVPRPRQVFALALNYPLHAAEARLAEPDDPLVFTKFPSCLTGPYATVELPSTRVDWEVELVLAIGHDGHRIPAERAWGHVAGVMVGQDLSERDVQLAGPRPQFSLGKSFPGFGPVGPALVTPDELDDPDDLALSCWLGDERVQHARTADLIFPVPELIARLSTTVRLLAGDLIFTGTPAGVGHGRDPRRYLGPGDVLTSQIDGVGEIRTTFAGPDWA